jgi:hypothetical protein
VEITRARAASERTVEQGAAPRLTEVVGDGSVVIHIESLPEGRAQFLIEDATE